MATWNHWCDATSTATTTVSSASSGGTATTTDTTWTSWQETDRYVVAEPAGLNIGPLVRDRVAHLYRSNQRRIESEWRDMERRAAEVTAQALLEDLLDDDQLEVYQETGRVLVKGRKHDYVVRRNNTTIKKLGKGQVADLCCHLQNRYKRDMPATDNTIAKILAIKADEERFNKLANVHRKYHGTLPKAARAA